MSRYVFDIEADNLLPLITRTWVISLFDIDKLEKFSFALDDLGWMEMMSDATLLIGHNIICYDIPALEKVHGWKPSEFTNIHDTLLMSQTQDYMRFGMKGHSLAVWGDFLKFPKDPKPDFSVFSEEMVKYCENDVALNYQVYMYLIQELKVISAKHPQFKTYLRAEHALAKFSARGYLHGWPFDLEGANELIKVLEDELDEAVRELEPKLGTKCVAIDKVNGEVIPKFPKWVKSGAYHSHTASYFDIDPWSGLDRPVDGPYSRVKFEPLKLSSVSDVKTFLFNNGWVPTEWNKKREGKDWIQTSPKITEDSIEFLGGDSKLYMNYKKTSSAYSTLKTWIAETDENGMLHGDARIVGTPSMRMRHSIIVNVKSTDTKWGKEMRALFKCLPGWKIVGCDSSGNQARGLAHYLKNPEYVDLLLNGDIHQHNADILTRVMHDLGFNITVPRSVAKRVLYATLFGASGGKIFGYIMGYVDDELGKALKEGFLGKIPGFHQLVEALEENWKKTKRRDRQGYIVGIAGNKIYVDSKHKLLVYLLQACEKATCAAAVMLTMEWLESEGIPYIPLIMMHDEEQFMVPEEFAERATQLGNAAFREAPKLFGINIMDGDGKYGDTWLDTH